MAKEEKRSFVLYCDYRKHLEILTDEERGQLLMALMDHAETGATPELDGAALMAFSFISFQMDRDAEKYAETCRKRSEAGKQGGRPPKAEKANVTDKKAKKANGFSQKQSKAKKGDNDNDNDNDTDNDSIITPLTPLGGESPTVQEKRFSEFWAEYPKKVGKKAALTTWKKLKPNAELFDRIMQSVKSAKVSEQWSREGGRYIPNPTTWLNQGRWDDELAPAKPVTPAKGTRRPSYDIDAIDRMLAAQGSPPPTAETDETVRQRAEELKILLAK